MQRLCRGTFYARCLRPKDGPMRNLDPAKFEPLRYDNIAVALHWLIAVALFAQLALGWWMIGLPKEPPGLRAEWFNLHKSLGILLGLFILFRVWWRTTHKPPLLPPYMPRWQRLLAETNHRLVYVGMVLLPVSGYLSSSFSKYPIKFFGYALPSWGWDWPAGKSFFSDVHEAVVWVFILLISIHIASVFWHLLHRDKVVSRILPHRRTRTET